MVCITGATGKYAAYINGFYTPTDEIIDKASVYKKLGDSNTWIEYDDRTRKWIVMSANEHEANIIVLKYAMAEVAPPLPLEDCPSTCWEVDNGSGFQQSDLFVSITNMSTFQNTQVVWINK